MTYFVRFVRLVFWTALAFTLFSALAPVHRVLRLLPWDKAQHFLAFYALTALGLAAYPRAKPLRIAVALSVLGALIELLQALPIVSRDSDFWDWVADTVAILAVLGPMILVAWRTRAGSPPAPHSYN